MGKLKITVHPLFFIFGLYFALTGKVFSFLVFTFCAVIHELGHSFASEKLGYKLNKITLMPYGAVISGDLTGLSYKDECRIAFAGPLVNLLIATLFLALWWIVPDIYPYTDLIVMANLSLAMINFIPAYPLDGGRLLLATLSIYMRREKAMFAVKCTGTAFSVVLLGLFIYTIFTGVNFSILFFALFMFFGVFCIGKENKYVKIFDGISTATLDKGAEIRTLAVSDSATVKTVYSRIDGNCLYEITVYGGGGKIIKKLSPFDVANLLNEKSLYDKII